MSTHIDIFDWPTTNEDDFLLWNGTENKVGITAAATASIRSSTEVTPELSRVTAPHFHRGPQGRQSFCIQAHPLFKNEHRRDTKMVFSVCSNDAPTIYNQWNSKTNAMELLGHFDAAKNKWLVSVPPNHQEKGQVAVNYHPSKLKLLCTGRQEDEQCKGYIYKSNKKVIMVNPLRYMEKWSFCILRANNSCLSSAKRFRLATQAVATAESRRCCAARSRSQADWKRLSDWLASAVLAVAEVAFARGVGVAVIVAEAVADAVRCCRGDGRHSSLASWIDARREAMRCARFERTTPLPASGVFEARWEWTRKY